MIDLKQLIRQRRSIRDFLDKPVSRELLLEMIHDSCLAPSAANNQPWQFIAIMDKTLMKNLSDESKKNILAGIKRQPDSPVNPYLSTLEQASYNIFYNAPCLVYMVGNPKVPSLAFDISLAAAYFMFSATSRGLGTCWIGLGKEIKDPQLLETIGLPAGHKIIAPIIVGYPREIPPTPTRKNPVINMIT